MNSHALSALRTRVFRILPFAVTLYTFAFMAGAQENPGVKEDPCPPLVPSFGETSGMRFRRIGIDGLLLPAAKEQAKPESDQANEETYVDSLTAQLRHDTSDIYIALPGGELSLAIKRSVSGEMWSHDSKAYHGDHPGTHSDGSGNLIDRPFGMGWTSGLAACLRIEKYIVTESSECSPPPRAYIIAGDENGMSYRFHSVPFVAGGSEEDHPVFIPVPSNRTETSAFFNTLVAEMSGGSIAQFVLTRKFGTKVTYSASPVFTKSIPLDSMGTITKVVSYFRITGVQDRFGNTLTYGYAGSGNTVVPSTITANIPGGTPRTLNISQFGGLVSTITNPRGHTWSYSYEYQIIDGFVLPLLSWVSAANEVSATHYDYRADNAADTEPKDPDDPTQPAIFYHINLLSITAGYGTAATIGTAPTVPTTTWTGTPQVTTFTYIWDETVILPAAVKIGGNYILQSYNPYPSRPRTISRIDLADGTHSTFTQSGLVTLSMTIDPANGHATSGGASLLQNGSRSIVVTDAAGSARTFTYSAPNFIDGHEIEDLLEVNGHPRPPYLLIAWTQCQVLHPAVPPLAAVSETATFNVNAGLADETVTDYSGNITSYEYDDPYIFSTAQPALQGTPLGIILDAIPLLSGFYNDPTKETTAVGTPEAVIKTFSYTGQRFMQEIQVKDASETVVRTTTYVVQAVTGNRTSETVTGGGATVVTNYLYDPTKKAFMTQKTVVGANRNSGTVTNLVTTFTPDGYGNIASTTVAGLTTSHLYDANNNRTWTRDPRNNYTYFTYDALNRLITVRLPGDPALLILRQLTGWSPTGQKIWERDQNEVPATARCVTIYRYDQRNRLLTTIKDMDAQGITLFGSQTDPDIVTSATYNGVGNVLTQTDGRVVTTKHLYDALHRKIQSTVDPTELNPTGLNLVTQYTYDGTNTGSSAFSGSSFKPTKVIDPRGYDTVAAYDRHYRPVKVWKEIDSNKFQASATDYDSFGNVVRTWTWRSHATDTVSLPGGSSVGTSTTYDALNRPLTITEGIVGASDTSLATVTVNSYTSTSLWRTTKTDGTIVRETETDFDAVGRPVKVWNGDAATGLVNRSNELDAVLGSGATEIEYDANGNKTGVRDVLNNWTRTAFDVKNRPTAVAVNPVTGQPNPPTSSPLQYDEITRTAYDQVGNPLTVTDARGYITTTTYDRAYRVTAVTTPVVPIYGQANASLVTQKEYDKNGNVTALRDPALNWTRNLYDNANRLLATAVRPSTGQPAPPTLSGPGNPGDIIVRNTYDAMSNLLTVADGMGSVTAFAYDGLGRKLYTKWDSQDVPRSKLDQQTTYDALMQTSIQDAIGRVINNYYDGRNRLTGIECVGAASQRRTMILDRAGRLVKVLHGGHTLPSSTLVTADGRNVEMSYDFLDRVVTENSAGIAHAYLSDKQGNRKQVTYGSTGRVLVSTYDRLHRLSFLEEMLPQVPPLPPEEIVWRDTVYHYDANGNVTGKDHANGTVEATVFDALNRRSSHQVNAGVTVLSSFAFGYDAASNLRQSVETVATGAISVDGRTVINAYDRTHRLQVETATEPDRTVATTYGYDDANNRTSKSVVTTPSGGPSTTENHTYVYGNTTSGNGRNSNQLYTWTKPDGSVVTYTYDENGNRTMQETSLAATNTRDTYSYDYFNRLIGVVQIPNLGNPSAFLQHTYAYDHRTRRVRRTEQTAPGTPPVPTPQTVSFSAGTSVLEYSGASLTVEYVRGSDWGGGIGGILYSSRASALSWAHYNGRGDVVTRSDSGGALTYAATYEAFGTRTQEAGSSADRQRANTKEEDPTGLLNEGMRYRDLATGMFLTRDPAGFVDGPNVYTYVRQNPWSAFDPEGLFVSALITAGFAAYDTYQYATGKMSGAEYAGAMALNGAALLADVATAGAGGGLAVRAASVAIKVAKVVDKADTVYSTANGAIRTAEAIANGDGLGAVVNGALTAAGAKGSMPGGSSAREASQETQQQVSRQSDQLSPTNYPNPDPPMNAPPVQYEPGSIDEVMRMRQGKGPTTKQTHGDQNIEAHHRGQVPVEAGGKIDEVTQQQHRGAGQHSRHSEPSQLSDQQRKREIKEHWKKRGSEYQTGDGEGI